MTVIVEIVGSGISFGPSQRRHTAGTHWKIVKAKYKPKKAKRYTPNWDALVVLDSDGNEVGRYQPGNWRTVWVEEEAE